MEIDSSVICVINKTQLQCLCEINAQTVNAAIQMNTI